MPAANKVEEFAQPSPFRWSCFYFFGSIEIRAQTSRPLSGSQSDPNPAMAQTRHIWREHIYRSWHAVGSRKQADHDCAHSFGTNCNGGNSSGKANITFKQEIDSLTISSFHLNGSDMLTSIPEMWNLTMGQYSSPVGPKLRLFPSDMVKQTKVQHETLTSEMWLLWPELIDGERSDLPGAGLEHANCMTWAIGDWVHYGGQPIDRVLFYRDENGKVVGFEAPFLRTGILRP
ncbi:hypothetical protein MY8738_005604 [Beauveria namnaoensis]